MNPSNTTRIQSVGTRKFMCNLCSAIECFEQTTITDLRLFEWPQGLQQLIGFGDNDTSEVGQLTAQHLAGHATAAGLGVQMMIAELASTARLDVHGEERA